MLVNAYKSTWPDPDIYEIVAAPHFSVSARPYQTLI